MISDINDPKFLLRLATRLRLHYGWSVAQANRKRLKEVFLATADLHEWEEEASTQDNKIIIVQSKERG